MSITHDSGYNADLTVANQNFADNYRYLAQFTVISRALRLFVHNDEFARLANSKNQIDVSAILDVFPATAALDVAEFGQINSVQCGGCYLRLYNIFQTPNRQDTAVYYTRHKIPSLALTYMIWLAQNRPSHTLVIDLYVPVKTSETTHEAKAFLKRFPISNDLPDDCIMTDYVSFSPRDTPMLFIVRAVSKKQAAVLTNVREITYEVGDQKYACLWRRSMPTDSRQSP